MGCCAEVEHDVVIDDLPHHVALVFGQQMLSLGHYSISGVDLSWGIVLCDGYPSKCLEP
jgi:hypothetical protein